MWNVLFLKKIFKIEEKLNLLIKNNYDKKEGIINICKIGESYLNYIGLDLLRLKDKQKLELKKEKYEIALVILEGKCNVGINNKYFENIGGRKDIFKENATAVYIPINNKLCIEAEGRLEALLCYGRTDKVKTPFIVNPKNVKVAKVGKDNYKRLVKSIIRLEHDVGVFIIGETISDSGNWSSFPPHKHDRDRLPFESKLEEIYFYRMQPSTGFALQRIYSEEKDLDETYTVMNYDSVMLPKGYHPVSSCPGYKTYYFWVLGGKKRSYGLYEDENYSWINK